MKKTIFTLVILLCVLTIINAQDELKSKKGIPILPEKGDYALGIDAVPFFEYFGNMLGSDFNPGPSFDFTETAPFTIYGKYFIDAKTAYRAKFQISSSSFKEREYVTKDAPPEDLDPEVTVEDEATYGNTDIVLGFGIEKRRGKGRVQGIYGAEAQLMFGSEKEKYTYGNMWDPDLYHYYTNFGTNVIYEPDGSFFGLVDENKMGGTFGIGIRGFVGVEYFFAPKISLGGEFGWGIDYINQGDGEITIQYEDFNSSNGEYFINTTTRNTGGSSEFYIGTDNMYGAINLFFYF